MMFWTSTRTTGRERKLQRQVKDLRTALEDLNAELDAEKRRSRIKDVELVTMAAVIARDRQRIEAETAGFARKQAEAEGTKK